jgi:hypothetical protein
MSFFGDSDKFWIPRDQECQVPKILAFTLPVVR